MLEPEALKKFQKKYAASATQEIQIIGKCVQMDSPTPPPPEKFPDPWLIDSEFLLKELDRLRTLILAIPIHNDTLLASQTAIDSIWRLRNQLQELLRLHREGQRSFAAKHAPETDWNAPHVRERIRILKETGKMRQDWQPPKSATPQ